MRWSSTLLALAVMLSLSGCSFHGQDWPDERIPEEGTVDLAEAKSEMLTIMAEVVAAFPVASITSSELRDVGTLLSCDERAMKWSGAGYVYLKEDEDVSAVLEHVEAAFDDREDIRSGREQLSSPPYESLVLESPEGWSLTIDPNRMGTKFQLSTFSRCVTDLTGWGGGPSY
jgi:hypothetical protein